MGNPGSIPGKGMASHSSILAWEIPRTEKPGRIQSMGLQRVGHNGVANTFSCLFNRNGLPQASTHLFCGLECECGGDPASIMRARTEPQELAEQQDGSFLGPWDLREQTFSLTLDCYTRENKLRSLFLTDKLGPLCFRTSDTAV